MSLRNSKRSYTGIHSKTERQNNLATLAKPESLSSLLLDNLHSYDKLVKCIPRGHTGSNYVSKQYDISRSSSLYCDESFILKADLTEIKAKHPFKQKRKLFFEYSQVNNKLRCFENNNSFSSSCPSICFSNKTQVLLDNEQVDFKISDDLSFEDQIQVAKYYQNQNFKDNNRAINERNESFMMDYILSERYGYILEPQPNDFMICFDISLNEYSSYMLFSNHV